MKATIGAIMRGQGEEGGEITIRGLNHEAREKVEGMVRGGMWYMTVKDGQPIFYPNFQPLPDPIEDKEMLPFWRKPTEGEKAHGTELFEMEELPDHSSPSIHIQHLCGYHYTPERYQRNAEILRSYGFDCMRSPRGDEGKYWESWYLPGLWSAKGDLKDHIGNLRNGKEAIKTACAFIARHVSFGTLDICVQRYAMTIED